MYTRVLEYVPVYMCTLEYTGIVVHVRVLLWCIAAAGRLPSTSSIDMTSMLIANYLVVHSKPLAVIGSKYMFKTGRMASPFRFA